MFHRLTFRPLLHPLILLGAIACLLGPTPAKGFVEILSGAEDAVDGVIDRESEARGFTMSYQNTPGAEFVLYQDDLIEKSEYLGFDSSAAHFELTTRIDKWVEMYDLRPRSGSDPEAIIDQASYHRDPVVNEYAEATLPGGTSVTYPQSGQFVSGDLTTRDYATIQMRFDQPVQYRIQHSHAGEEYSGSSLSLRSSDETVGDSGLLLRSRRYFPSSNESNIEYEFEIDGHKWVVNNYGSSGYHGRELNDFFESNPQWQEFFGMEPFGQSLEDIAWISAVEGRYYYMSAKAPVFVGYLPAGEYEIDMAIDVGCDGESCYGAGNFTFSATPVPEPTSMLGLLGGLGVTLRRRVARVRERR